MSERETSKSSGLVFSAERAKQGREMVRVGAASQFFSQFLSPLHPGVFLGELFYCEVKLKLHHFPGRFLSLLSVFHCYNKMH